jgi:hypothetical protein
MSLLWRNGGVAGERDAEHDGRDAATAVLEVPAVVRAGDIV